MDDLEQSVFNKTVGPNGGAFKGSMLASISSYPELTKHLEQYGVRHEQLLIEADVEG